MPHHLHRRSHDRPEHNFPAFHAEAARLRHLGCEISRVEEVRLPSTVPPTQDLELIRSSSCGWLLRPGLSASACGSCRGRRPPPETVKTLFRFFFFFTPSITTRIRRARAAPLRSHTRTPSGPGHRSTCFLSAFAVNSFPQYLHCWSIGLPFESVSPDMELLLSSNREDIARLPHDQLLPQERALPRLRATPGRLFEPRLQHDAGPPP